MKLAFVIAAVAALNQAAVTHAECDFGSNYTSYYNDSGYCSFDVGIGYIDIGNFSESNTISSGDTNVTTITYREDWAIWKVIDKDSTVQCYSNITYEYVLTSYQNGSTFYKISGNFVFGSNGVNDTVAEGVPLSSPGLYYVKGGLEGWMYNDDNGNVTKAEGDITDLCEVLGGGEGAGDDAGPAPTPKPPTTEAPSSGQMAAVTIIPCVAAVILNYFFS